MKPSLPLRRLNLIPVLKEPMITTVCVIAHGSDNFSWDCIGLLASGNLPAGRRQRAIAYSSDYLKPTVTSSKKLCLFWPGARNSVILLVGFIMENDATKVHGG